MSQPDSISPEHAVSAPGSLRDIRWRVADFSELPAVDCSCGQAQRAFTEVFHAPASIHRTQITADARAHYHQRQTETYYILECEPGAGLELDGEFLPVRPGMCILIPPGVRHRGTGRMTILNIVVPRFDAADEFFD